MVVTFHRKKADSIFLCNVESNKREGFKLPPENTLDIIYYKLNAITNNSLTIIREIQFSGEEKVGVYNAKSNFFIRL